MRVQSVRRRQGRAEVEVPADEAMCLQGAGWGPRRARPNVPGQLQKLGGDGYRSFVILIYFVRA